MGHSRITLPGGVFAGWEVTVTAYPDCGPGARLTLEGSAPDAPGEPLRLVAVQHRAEPGQPGYEVIRAGLFGGAAGLSTALAWAVAWQTAAPEATGDNAEQWPPAYMTREYPVSRATGHNGHDTGDTEWTPAEQRWHVANNPVGAVSIWPELAAEFDAEWSKVQKLSDPVDVRIQQMRELAAGILARAGAGQASDGDDGTAGDDGPAGGLEPLTWRWDEHTNAAGARCAWSGKPATENDDDGGCPAGCRESYLEPVRA